MESWQIVTRSPEETRELGRRLGELAGPGLDLFLDGDLGSGKTCLSQGVALGLGVAPEEPVTSPTYTLMNQYRGRCELYHFDFYRLAHPDELVDIDFEEHAGAGGVTVVEWAGQLLGTERPGLHARLESAGEESRRLQFRACGARAGEVLDRLAAGWREGEGA